MSTIKKITATDTFSVRHPVLRSGKPLESCHFDGDTLATTSHFGLFLNQKIIGVLSLFTTKNNVFSEKLQFQIRGMAVLKEFQKKGFGASLITHCEKECHNRNGNLIWFNARTEATGFYEKLGYQKTGIPFEIQDVGEHFLMFKKM
jgi:GNAT superfamily N-acetyltransferase